MSDDVLGRMVIELGLDHSQFGNGLEGAKRETKYAMAEMKSNMSVVSASGKQLDILQTKQASLNKAIEAQSRVVAEQRKQYEGSLTKTGAATGATAKYATQLQNANAKLSSLKNQLDTTASAYAKNIAGSTGFTGALNKMSTAAGASGERLKSIGGNLTSIGSKMSVGITAPIVGGFVAAAKSAVDFNSQISAIGPLLTNGGAVTAQYRQQLDQMADSSKKWAVQYGTSTEAINDGMTEMVKRGYTAQQTMGAMPAVLDAAKASGDDFNDVMHVSTATLEQFGLKTESTSGMLKNTSRVTDSLTYVANATAAGFKDMGEAMTYVGPSAHAAGISLEETAAAIGIMSNKGIEGSVAGTALRGALTRLMKPSKQNIQGFEELGIKVDDFKNGTLTLPEILDKVKNNTKGWTDQQRASAIALAFGTEAQAGMNALISAGGDELRNYTKGAETASGTTKKIADQLNDTQAAKVARFKESLHVLGITIGQQLLPTFTPLIEKATDMVSAFSKMDSGTQQSILKWLAFAAAVGPVTGVLGNIFKVAGTGASAFSAVTGGLARAGTAAKVGASGFDILKSMFSKTSFEALKATPALGTLGAGATGVGESMIAGAGGTTGFLSALAPFAPAILGAVAVIGVGAAAWELWGKKAVESSERTKRWGSDIGADADQAATKFEGFNSRATTALGSFESGVKGNAGEVKSAFNDMSKAISDSADKANTALDKELKRLPPAVSGALQASVDARKKSNGEQVSLATDLTKNVLTITKRASSEHRALTADENTYVLNAQKQMNEAQVNLLDVSSKQRKQVLAALNGDIGKMNTDQRSTLMKNLKSSLDEEDSLYAKQKKAAKDLYTSGAIDAKQYKQAISDLADTHSQKTDQIAGSMYNLMKKNGASVSQIKQVLHDFGLSYDDAQMAAEKMAKGVDKSNSLLSSSSSKASKEWNNLIWDDKKAKVRTNLPEFLLASAKVKGGWKALNFELKHAKISTNAKQMIAETLSMSDEWKSLPDMEKTAILREEGADKIAGIMDQFVEWNSLSLKDQQAVVKGNYQPLVDALIKNNQWNQMSLKQQEALVADKATVPLITSLAKMGEWDKIKPEAKEAIIKAKGKEELAEAVAKYGLWDKLPEKEKKLLISDKDARQKLLDADVNIGQYNATPVPAKELKAHHEDLMKKLSEAKVSVSELSQAPAIKKIIGNNEDLIQKLNTSDAAMQQFNSLPSAVKKLIADAYGFNLGIDQATGKLVAYNSLDPNTKNPGVNITPVVNAFGAGINSILQYNGQNPNEKHTTASDVSLGSTLSAGTSQIGAYNSIMPATKILNGNANGVLSATNTASSAIYGYMGIIPPTKGLNANDNATGPANSAVSALAHFRDMGDITRTITTVSKMISVAAKAKGTNDFEGGMAMVNDQPGPVFRELVEEPGKAPYIPIGRRVVLPLKKHAKVVPATTTARMFKNLPQFADGLNVPANVAPVRMARELTSEISETSNTGDNGALQVIIGLLATIAKQNPADLITAMLGKIELSTDVTLDKRSMAKFVSQVANQDIAKAISRAKGGKAI